MFNAIIEGSLNNKLLVVVATIIFFGVSIYQIGRASCRERV